MEYVSYAIVVFVLVQLVVSLFNLWYPERLISEIAMDERMISILVPARNEEVNIKACVQTILNQDYQNFELLIGDDQSSDKTAKIVRKLAKGNSKVRLVPINKMPKGWLGKNYACSVLAAKATGDYLLFLDADVRIFKNIIPDSINHMRRHKLQMLSLFPHQILQSVGEKKTIPMVYFILLSLLPLRLVRKTRLASLAAANGQFMMFKTTAYQAVLPHQAVRDNCVEDIAISRLFKSKGHRIACSLSDQRVECRMYNNYKSSVKGFSKNVTAFFGNSLFFTILFWFITTLGFIPVFIGTGVSGLICFISLSILTRIVVIITCKQTLKEQLKLMLHHQLSLGLFILHHLQTKVNGHYEWKGRNILAKSVK